MSYGDPNPSIYNNVNFTGAANTSLLPDGILMQKLQSVMQQAQQQQLQNVPGMHGGSTQVGSLGQAQGLFATQMFPKQMFATQMQGASLIPTNPVAGDIVQIYFDGQQWVKVFGPPGTKSVGPVEHPAFSLDEINQAEDEIEHARRAA